MTRDEWLTTTDVHMLLVRLTGRASERKSRLAACACCRAVPDHLLKPDSRAALDLAERCADGDPDGRGRRRAADLATAAWRAVPRTEFLTSPEEAAARAVLATCDERVAGRLDYVLATCRRARLLARTGHAEHAQGGTPEEADQVAVLRDVFGNTFGPAAAGPGWLTSTAAQLARGIYDERAFDRLPYLADALQDAGCEDEQVLAHCRGPGPHARGCWVVDLVLCKS